MKYCSTCDNHYPDEKRICPICESLYKKDLEKGLIPPGISKENYDVMAWQIFKGVMKDARLSKWSDKVTLEHVERRMKDYERTNNRKRLSPSKSEQCNQYAELADLGKDFLERLRSGDIS